MSDITDPVVPAPTQVEHPVKAALRTGIQAFLSTAAILVIALPYVQDFVAEFWPGSPAVAFIGSAGVFIGALAALGTNLPALQPYIAPPVYAALVLVVEVMRSLLMVVNIFIGGSPL